MKATVQFCTMVVIATITVGFVLGCGQKASVQDGDTLEVVQEIRTKAVVQPEDTFQERFTVVVPSGSILKVVDNPNVSSSLMNVQVVSIDGNTDQDFITQRLVPDRVYSQDEYQGFYITLPLKYVGEEVKIAK